MTDSTQIAKDLAEMLSEKLITSEAKDLNQYAIDGMQPKAVVFPKNTQQVSDIIKYANEKNLAVVPRGSGSKIAMGHPPKRLDLVVCTSRMNHMKDVDVANLTLTVEAGVKFLDIQARLATEDDRCYLPLEDLTSDTDELIKLAKVVGQRDGLYASHIRGERETNIAATLEFIRVAEEGQVRGQMSHMQSKYPVFGNNVMKMDLLTQARARGVDVTVDSEAFPDCSGSPSGFLQIYRLTPEELVAKLSTHEGRADIKRTMRGNDPWHPLGRFGPGGVPFRRAWDRVTIWDCPHDRALEGKSVAAVAAERGIEFEDALFDLAVAEGGRGPRFVHHYIEDDHFRTASWEHCIFPSVDTGLYDPATRYTPLDLRYWKETAYPGTIGLFPRVLGQFVREERLLTVEEAVRKMTSLPMQRLGITERGAVRPGMWADLVVFDKETIALRSDDADPEHFEDFYPVGIDCVVVNGEVTIEGHRHTGARAGHTVRSGDR